ncbi:hypothetical protein BROSI_A3567 [Candidatus Brocadia sinica JPN1]|uniref:Uncharacterized protein n=1 Tax=Candidatus Brocadia sinica JPN1 TaxID=1197129 RepID=A0ABQ0K1S1_9BACT|nr:hypothetical protein BROSI_A3567 [Candidatus Brocadia sinica JPN1]
MWRWSGRLNNFAPGVDFRSKTKATAVGLTTYGLLPFLFEKDGE